MALYRPQRGSFNESMTECITVNSLQALAEVLSQTYDQVISADDINIRVYIQDHRNGWDTHVVTLNGNAVGFTNSSLT